MGQLAGKVALVTGGAKSLGKAFARALAADGAAVVIADIVDGSVTAADIVRDFAVAARARVCGVSREADVEALVAATMTEFGRIDILVNNAALFATLPLLPHGEITVEMWDSVMAVNVRGPFLMAKHVSPHMIAGGGGKIVNIGSGTANKGRVNMLAYVTSKAAILGLTRSLARELGGHGICVNTLSPGLTESDSVREHPHQLAGSDRSIASRAIPRLAVAEDLLGALVFLAGPGSDFITGQTIAVDGGSVNT